jgi:hypothetical protein
MSHDSQARWIWYRRTRRILIKNSLDKY